VTARLGKTAPSLSGIGVYTHGGLMSSIYLTHLGVLPRKSSDSDGKSQLTETQIAVDAWNAKPKPVFDVSPCESTISTSWCNSLQDKRLRVKEVTANWVHGLARWDVILHLTFAWEASIDSGRRCFEKWMRRHYPHVSYFYALESNGVGRDYLGFHVHALWAGAGGVVRRQAWFRWFKRFGRARIEPVRCPGDVSGYCSKYVTKEGSWWNVKLQWHLIEAINGRKFVLI
jgi:hypothetical protein